MVALIFQAISLLTLPFSGGTLNETLAEYGKLTGTPLPPLSPEMINLVLWLSFGITAALILWLYNTRRAVLEGKSWGRVSAIVIAMPERIISDQGHTEGMSLDLLLDLTEEILVSWS